MEDTHILTVESITEAEVLLTTEESTSWLLDSGASYHVTLFRSQFRSYTTRDFEPVRVGNSLHCAVVSIGSVELSLNGASTLVLFDVRHVPDYADHLSLWGNSRKQASVPASLREDGHLTVAASSLPVDQRYTHCTRYTSLLERADSSWLIFWCRRFGYLSKSGITHVSRAGYIPKLSFSNHQFCEHYQYGKQTAVPIRRAHHVSQVRLT